jgi:hypothetical protein
VKALTEETMMAQNSGMAFTHKIAWGIKINILQFPIV